MDHLRATVILFLTFIFSSANGHLMKKDLDPPKTQLVFLGPPENYAPKIEVAACFIKSKDQVLFLKRVPQTSEGECWGIPGGKLEKEETAHVAVLREVQEETGLTFLKTDVKHIRTVFIRYPHIDFTYHMFETDLDTHPSVSIDPSEHSDFKWITLIEALQLTLIPGEDECIKIAYGEIQGEAGG